jgi:hypothetical protein
VNSLLQRLVVPAQRENRLRIQNVNTMSNCDFVVLLSVDVLSRVAVSEHSHLKDAAASCGSTGCWLMTLLLMLDEGMVKAF